MGDEGPPALTITAGEASIMAGIGSFCWEGLCADAIGYITPANALRVVDASELHAELASETFTEISVTASPTSSLESQAVCTGTFTPVGPTCLRDHPLLAWTGALGQGSELSTTADGGAVEVDISALVPGTYVVYFSVTFEAGADAGYAVVLEVLPR